MNKERRKAIEVLAGKLDELKGDIDTLLQEENDYFDNMPESFQNGEKGERAQAAIDALQEAYDSCEAAFEALNTATE
ncbi:hypothetical protein [Rhizobium phage RHph_X2_30]|nr:hypothetical protein [Rhizobium phage RHph_X2_30]